MKVNRKTWFQFPITNLPNLYIVSFVKKEAANCQFDFQFHRHIFTTPEVAINRPRSFSRKHKQWLPWIGKYVPMYVCISSSSAQTQTFQLFPHFVKRTVESILFNVQIKIYRNVGTKNGILLSALKMERFWCESTLGGTAKQTTQFPQMLYHLRNYLFI
jgi:hypothetical protein